MKITQWHMIMVAVVLAIAANYSGVQFLISIASVTSEMFIGLLKLISLPVVFLSVLSTVYGLENMQEVKSLASRVVFYTLFTTIIAVLIGLVMYKIVDPADVMLSKIDIDISNNPIDISKASYKEHLLSMFPTNFVKTFLDNNVMGVIIIAFLLGGASLFMESSKRKLLSDVFGALFDNILKVAQAVIYLMPLAVWSFVLLFLNDLGSSEKDMGLLLSCVLCISASIIIQAVIVLPSFLLYHGLSPMKIFRGSLPALTLAFFSRSSGAALPTTIKCAQDKLGISKKTSQFALPICATINMNACAAFILIIVMFVCESNGYYFGALDIVTWIFLSLMAAVGNAGVPMGCYFMATTYLVAMDMPLTLMVMLLPIHTMFDMLETSVNVWSDVCIAAIVDKKERA